MKKFFKRPVFYLLAGLYVLLSTLSLICVGGSTTKKFKVDTSTVSISSSKQISKKILNTVSRYGAGVFLTAGDDGVIFTTANSGVNWIARTSGTTDSLLGSAVLNYDTMIVAGTSGTILRSTDKGANWTSISSGTTKDIKSLSFVDKITGYAAGDSGLVLKTSDAGVTWSDISIADIISMNSICFIKNPGVQSDYGWAAVDEGKVYRTTNSGASWGIFLLPGTTSNMNGISFNSLTRGSIVGDSGKVYGTTDGGVSWSPESSGTFNSLNGIHRVNDRLAYIAGDGIIIREDNGVYTTLLSDPANIFNAVDPSPYLSGIVVGSSVINEVTVSGCDPSSVLHSIQIEDITVPGGVPEWKLIIGINRSSGEYINMLRIITPGYTLGETVINSWVEMDTPSGNGNPQRSIHHPTGLNDYIDIDLTQYTPGGSHSLTAIPIEGASIRLEYKLTPNPNNLTLNGSFQCCFSRDAYSTDVIDISENFCHSVTYSLTEEP
jgi:photosystem II stability/assembly factor-like uncharacterized protein